MSDRTAEVRTEEAGARVPAQALQTIFFDVALIDPSPYQARKRFDERGLEELGASLLEHGVIQPLVARVSPTHPGRLELVAGERRWRAATRVGMAQVPVIIRTLGDTEAEELMLIENLQREDLTESEEAHGYERMLALKDAAGAALYTVASLAAKISKDSEYVVARLKLLLCPAEMVAAVDAGEASVSVAMLVGRIPDAKARAECAKEVLRPEMQQVPLNVAQTKELIRERYMVRLNSKDFDLKREELVPVKLEGGERVLGGACVDCPFRSGNLEGVELKKAGSAKGVMSGGGGARGSDANLCTLPRCHKMKMDAVWREMKLDAEKKGLAVLDGNEATREFSGHEGRLRYDSDLVPLSENVGSLGREFHSKSWKAMLKDSAADVTVILARNPYSGQVVELVKKAEAGKAVQAALKGAEKTPDEAKRAEDERERRAGELRQQKLDKIIVREGVSDIVERIQGTGVDADFLGFLFQMALDSGGSDGMNWMGQWLEIKLPKGGHHSGRDFEEKIIEIAKQRCETPNGWLAFITIALMARDLKWQGVRCDDFEQILNRVGGRLPALKRRAEALLVGEEKGKVKGKAGGDEPTLNSTDPVDVSSEKEADRTRAADTLAKGAALAPEADKSVRAPLDAGAEFRDALAVEELRDELFPELAGAAAAVSGAAAGFAAPAELSFEAQVEGLRTGKMKMTDVLGVEPLPRGSAENKAWGARRVKLCRALKKAGGVVVSAPVAADLSEAERVHGVPADVLGFPSLFTVALRESAAKCLAAGTTSIEALLGAEPDAKKEKRAHQTWKATRGLIQGLAASIRGKMG